MRLARILRWRRLRCWCWVRSAFAQTSGAVVGTIADAQGATVPGANITLINESRGTTQDTQSTGDGRFHLPERAA